MDLRQLFILGSLIFIPTLVHSFNNYYWAHTACQTLLYAQGRNSPCLSWGFKLQSLSKWKVRKIR